MADKDPWCSMRIGPSAEYMSKFEVLNQHTVKSHE